MGKKVLVQYKKLSKTYMGSKNEECVEALKEITFDVYENEFVTVVGPSGCGKSTLLNITAGILPYTSGELFIDEVKIKEPTPNIGIVFQAPTLLEWRSVLDNVLLPVEILGKDKKKYYEEAMNLIKLVGLQNFERRYPWELSGGMQQRVSICRSLIHDPKLLLMDEPFGALDAITRDRMDLELLRIWKEKRKTVIYITHSIPESVFLADRVVVLSARPAKVVKIVKVNLPRPRTVEMQYTKKFKDYCHFIVNLIAGEAEREEPIGSGNREFH